ncbi:MAG: MBL fold metallo-hydrolase [Nanoarchaeota archaeon]
MKPANNALQNISTNIWKLAGDGNVYFLDFEKKIFVDTGSRMLRPKIEMFLSKVVDFLKVDYVVLTHLHLDHVGNIDLFPNATLLASQAEIDAFNANPDGAVLDSSLAAKIKQRGMTAIETVSLPGLEVIQTPGHTSGSICLWYAKEGVLFSGDTIFHRGIGRMDLPTSVPDIMQTSLNKLSTLPIKKLCAGHDYGLEEPTRRHEKIIR